MDRMILELKNESDLKFSNISSEGYREYEFESGRIVRINKPQWLNISSSGGHRILDATGVSHYVPSGWIWLRWKALDNEPHFVQ